MIDDEDGVSKTCTQVVEELSNIGPYSFCESDDQRECLSPGKSRA